MKIIPAIDIINGKAVRLTRGDYDTKKEYSAEPLALAKSFEDAGFTRLHVVDLDGAKAGAILNLAVLENICTHTQLEVDFGGGIKSNNEIQSAYNAGACLVCVGSVALQQPDLFREWISTYGAEKLILSADVNERKIASQGWLHQSETDVIDFIKAKQKDGITRVMCTDISKDGMLQGPALALYKLVIEETDVKIIASGGIASMEDIEALKKIGCEGAVVGKAIYENKISLKELSAYA
ncbi:MAG: 1-(5-phosphoribosyl)-5-[(5-phosphoribosylamino)methylideneamino]imidazole-4-carboxamide isomerase [Ferruginibacter sp.]